MWTIAATLMLYALGQAPDQQALETRTRAIPPFIDSGVVAVVQLDLTPDDLPASSAGWQPARGRVCSKMPRRWCWPGLIACEGPAKELFIIVNLADMPGLPLVVVPLSPGADAAEIGRLFCGGGKRSRRSCSRPVRPSTTPW